MVLFGLHRKMAIFRRSIARWAQRPARGQDTGILIYDPISKQKIPLVLQGGDDRPATWYSCGPTVYDSAHIGHASCYLKLDVLQRILVDYFGINLITAMGITDIDDKIINRSRATGKTCQEITSHYEKEFWKNLSDLNIRPPDLILRVTDHIPTIERFIEKVEKNNLCYRTEDGSVFFDTEAYGKYRKFREIQNEIGEEFAGKKKNSADFALWKGHKPDEPFWESKWGRGRPGWHVECSAMVSRAFGSRVDFHAGGIDLKFPHHENEEAQSCAFHGTDRWVDRWIHAGHLHLKNDVKMSKSLKNTISIDDMLSEYGASIFRMACLCSHYRHRMEFGEEMMSTAAKNLDKFKNFLEECDKRIHSGINISEEDEVVLRNALRKTETEVDESLKDDFDTSKSISSMINLIGEVNRVFHKNQSPIADAECDRDRIIVLISISKYVSDLFSCFGIDLKKTASVSSDRRLPPVIDLLIDFRHTVRKDSLKNKNKDLLSECDNVRNKLKENKIIVKDQSDLSTWHFEE